LLCGHGTAFGTEQPALTSTLAKPVGDLPFLDHVKRVRYDFFDLIPVLAWKNSLCFSDFASAEVVNVIAVRKFG
jgi:hypothetical protein